MDLDQYKRPKQLLLFDDEKCLRNEGVLELTRLNLERAKEAFDRYQAFYPKGDEIDSELKITDFLAKGFQNAPVGSPDMPLYLYQFWKSFEDYLISFHYQNETIVLDIKHSFFERIVRQ